MHIDNQSNIGKIVAENYKAASVFKQYGIDFCCNGNRTIESACRKKQIDPDKLLTELQEAVTQKGTGEIDFKSFPPDLLADYIEKTHHRYVEKKIIEITPYLNRIVQVHGENHPELLVVEQLFQQSAGDLTAHMKKEELVLFPYIRRLVQSQLSGSTKSDTPLGTIAEVIARMEQDHEAEGERFRSISELTDNYNPPADACNTYRVTFSLLHEFEEDLHRHIHLENNILFPKAIELEKTLSN
ncbi:MAG: iron-sulfur cluster repair di-iron protein [Proteiniphilum sp.]|jgi:regulator of cell morphogenesis and NO signaling|nr:iron-sulfur cluster repair di-iron protein [Proteiniphilum sp.]